MFYRTGEKVPYYKSDMLGSIPHGFATRYGGVSKGEYTKSMNFAFGRGDSDSEVIKNFEIFAHAIGTAPENGVMLGQIHSANVLNVTKDLFGLGVNKKTDLCLDGFVSSEPGALLCVRVADCIPILFSDEKNRVIGAVHAGWRGSAAAVAVNCIEKMTELGAKKDNISVAIGPGICKSCYTVGMDFICECKRLLGEKLCSQFICKDTGEQYHADLKLLNKLLLINAGLHENNIDIADLCTCCSHEEFFSHRYHKNNRGTLCAMIALPENGGEGKLK